MILQYPNPTSVYNIKNHSFIFFEVGNALKSFFFQIQTKPKGHEKGQQRPKSQLATGGSNFFLMTKGME